jgi:hypothetical protein
MPDESPDDGAIRDVTQRLEVAYQDRCTSEQVSRAVSAAFEHFEGSRIRDFVPVLAERVARVALDGQTDATVDAAAAADPAPAVDPAAPA